MVKNHQKYSLLLGIFSCLIANFPLNALAINNTKNSNFVNQNHLSIQKESISETTLLARSGCQVNQFETQVFQLTNQVRQKYGLSPLRWNCQLIEAAQKHTRDMANMRRISHTGSDGSQLADRVRRVGYRYSYIAENVAAGYRSPEAVVNGWMNSPGHRKNILNPNATEIGIGFVSIQGDRYGSYWTQVFGRR
ncbi:MAG: CAP domain-containing protein [Prochloraceae cyanobacterium]